MLIIPDIHGRDFWKEEVREKSGKESIVFLGDYTDPYPSEGFDPSGIPSQIEEILEIPGAIRLLGNHDLSYVLPGMPRCRYQREQEKDIKDLILGNREKFQIIYEIPGYLFSHSGVLEDWMGDFTPDIINELWWEGKDDGRLGNLLSVISWWRGGYDQFGSCVWSDIHEWVGGYKPWKESEYFQIFGHTMLKEGSLIEKSSFACVDCQRPVILEDGKLIVK